MATISDVRRFASGGSSLLRGIVTWPVASQQVARHNALVAATRCTARRREREEVDEFLSVSPASPVSPVSPASTARTAPAPPAGVRGA